MSGTHPSFNVNNCSLLLVLVVLQTIQGRAEDQPAGPLSVYEQGPTALGRTYYGFPNQQWTTFREGRRLFERNWVREPPQSGKPSRWIAESCVRCHHLHSRQFSRRHPAEFSGHLPLTLKVGSQQDSLAVVYPHGPKQDQMPTLDWVEAERLREPTIGVAGKKMATIRMPLSLHGIGLLETIPAKDLQRAADPEDQDGDGISGVLPLRQSGFRNEKLPGRFGWTSDSPTLEDQIVAALTNESGLRPDQTGDLPITELELKTLASYIRALSVPRYSETLNVKGERLFHSAGCTACHKPKWQVPGKSFGQGSAIEIRPYTDLLLHDLGPELADAFGQSEWRTPPLWGLRFQSQIFKREFLLHDGRARTVAEAILWHGGEAKSSRSAFLRLTKEQKENLIRFVRQL